MPALSSPDLVTWRTAPYSVYFDAYIHAPRKVFEARINMASVVYPLTSLTFDGVTTGAYTDIQPEMLLTLGSSAGADDYGRARTNTNFSGVATSTTVHIGRTSQGRNDGELDVIDNAYLTVWDLHPIMAAPPLIDTISDPDNPSTLKDGYLGFNSVFYFMPVPILGGDRLKIVDSVSDTATFDFDSSDSYTLHPDAVGGITARQWYVGDGVITVGADTDDAITVEFPVGERYIYLAVQDSLGNIEVGWRLVVVAEKGNANLISGLVITRGTKRADGHEITLRVTSPIPYSTYIDGTEILIRQRERYGSALTGSLAGQADATEMWFSGWIQSEQNTGEANRQGFIARSELTLTDSAGRLKTLPGFPQVVDRKDTPMRWEHMQGANIDRYVYMILKWQSNAITRCDFRVSGTGDTYGFSTLGSDGKSLWDQANERTNAIAYALTCDKHSRLSMLPDPYLAPTVQQVSDYSLTIPARDSTVIVPILPSDWSSYRYSYTRSPRVHWNWGNAIQVTTVDVDSLSEIPTLFVVSPQAPNQGLGEQTSSAQLAISLNELRVREGNRQAQRMNNRFGYLETDIRPGDAGIDPALMQSVTFTIDSAQAGPRGRTMAAPNFLPIEINYTYDHKKGLRRTTLTLEREDAVGAVAVNDPQPQITQSQIPPYVPPMVIPPTLSVPPVSFLPRSIQRMAVICASGLARTLDFQTPAALGGPTFTGVSWVSLSISGTVLLWCPDPAHPGSGWIFTTTHIYYLVLSTATATDLFSWSNTAQSVSADASFNADDLGFVGAAAYSQGHGCYAAVATDGATFSESLIDSHYVTDGASFGINCGFCIPSHGTGKAITSVYSTTATTATALCQGKITTNHGSSWGDLSSPLIDIDSNLLAQQIHFPWNGNSAETMMYYTAIVAASDHRLRRVNGGTTTDITPVISGNKYAPRQPRDGIQTAVQNRLRVVTIAQRGGGNHAGFLSNDGGDHWVTILGDGTNARHCALSGDDQNTGWVWGTSSYLQQMTISGLTVVLDNRAGNLASLSLGDNIAIAGY